MAIEWGTESGHMQVGIDISQSPSSIGHDTNSVTLTVDYYVRSVAWGFDDTQTLNFSGDITGTAVSYYFYSAYGTTVQKLVATRTLVVTTSYTTAYTKSFTGTLSDVYGGGTPTKTRSWTVAKKPIAAPASPTNAQVAYVSDTQASLTWSNTSPTDSGHPYQNIEVYRSVDDAAFAKIATLGVVTSYTATGLSADHKYEFRIYAKNTAGLSGYSETGDLFTTPAPPISVVAAKSGTDIAISWDHVARYPTGSKVYASADGGAYTLLLTLGTTAESVNHSASGSYPDPAKTWSYTVTATNGSRESAQSAASNTVQLEAPPLAPTSLSPTGAVDGTEGQTFSWQHNPVDTSAQTAYELQRRVVGAGTWVTTGKVTSSASLHAFTPNSFVNGNDYEWQVRTWGAHVDPSPFSSVAVFTASNRPTATISDPTTAGVTTSSVVAQWAYYDAESTAQSGWEAKLWWMQDGVTPVLQQSKSGSDASTSAAFTTTILDGETYRVDVRVKDGAGLWSEWDQVTFAVTYAPPATPTLEATWDPDTGSASLTATEGTMGVGEVPTELLRLERSINGATWITIEEDAPVDGVLTVSDRTAPLGIPTEYRAVAVSGTPSTAEGTPVTLDTSSNAGWAFLSGGDGFSQWVRLRDAVLVGGEASRSKRLYEFSGREDALEVAGVNRRRVIQVSGYAGDGGASTLDEFIEVTDLPAPVLYRDCRGTRIFGSVNGVTYQYAGVDLQVGFTVSKVGYSE